MKKVVLILLIPFLLFANPVVAEKEANLQEEIIYDILVDRFNNGDPALKEQVRIDDPFAYNGGDLIGITTKLDRIQQLGFTTIVLSSIMENAPDGYHGYWIEDFYSVEEQFGTMEDLNILIEEAHQRDIKVVMEFVTNYVGLTHSFVTEKGKEDWFQGNTVEQIDSTTWLDNVAVLNQDNEEVVAYLKDVADYWMKETDLDGFKLHATDQSSEAFLTEFTEHIKGQNPNFYLLANILDAEADTGQIRSNPNIDAVENYAMLEKMNEVFTQVGSPISTLYDEWQESGSNKDLLLVDNKNTARFSNNFADQGRNAVTTWKLALTYMYTTPGIPLIYQGSELPMYGPGFPENQGLVLFNSTDPDIEEVLDRISALRSEFPALLYGDFEQLETNGAMSLFKRSYEGETIYIAINNDEASRSVTIKGIDPDMKLRGLLLDNTVRGNEDGDFEIGIERESAEVFIIEEDKGFNWLLIGFIIGVMLLFVFGVTYLSRKQKKEGR